MLCRFENRHQQQALVLSAYQGRADAYAPSDLPAFYAAIEAAQAEGWWTALRIQYEFGYWMVPGLDEHAPPSRTPLISALFFKQQHYEQPWQMLHDETVALHCTLRTPKHRYLKTIERIQHHIRQGDYYQLNYTAPIDVRTSASPETVYRQIAQQHPTPYAVYWDDGEQQIASFSPELFVQHRAQRLYTRPMKGTRPRFADPIADAVSADALRRSAKDCAENVMIVDLLRNDLGQLATPGSVSVDALLEVEQYPSVWTMTSSISAHCAQPHLARVLPALFPCGSITGAPKRAAMEALLHLESSPRGVYCGSLGWLAPNGDFTLNVAIRTLSFDTPETATFGVGGGIVIDSDAEQEWQELFWKARLLHSTIHYHE